MSYVTIEGLNKHFAGKPPTTAIDDLDLEIEEGEFLVLLGPSGCGKTTTLRCLAGLETPSSGTISFGGRKVFDSGSRIDTSPDKRNLGMVFQSYALWPHMTVRKNIGYPLRARKIPRSECRGWVEDVAGARRLRPAARPVSRPTERRPAAARRVGTGPRRPTRPGALRRTAEQPRRPVARPGAGADP